MNGSDEMGEFVLSDRIGQGGMAAVFRAVRRSGDLQRSVVVKRMLPERAVNEALVELFRTEARVLALLNHSNIVQFLEFGIADGLPYIVMEYLEGRDVAQILDQCKAEGKRLPIEATIAIGIQMCQGLGWAHELKTPDGARHQIIHRDVTPANVMLCRDGGVKLLDFGVAKITREFAREITTLKGKYGYMAPEQVRGEPIDRRVDVFAAGIVLHEMLTGRRLFNGATPLESLRQIEAARVRPPSATNPDVPPELDAIVMRALSADPVERYSSASDLCDALEALSIRPYSRKRMSTLLESLFPDDSITGGARLDNTMMDLQPAAIEIIASIGSTPILSSRSLTPLIPPVASTRPRHWLRAATIGVSALLVIGAAALGQELAVRRRPPGAIAAAAARSAAPAPAIVPSPPEVSTAAPQVIAPTPAVTEELPRAARPVTSHRRHARPTPPRAAEAAPEPAESLEASAKEAEPATVVGAIPVEALDEDEN